MIRSRELHYTRKAISHLLDWRLLRTPSDFARTCADEHDVEMSAALPLVLNRNSRCHLGVDGPPHLDHKPSFPLYDLVICHGDFLNPMRGYVHLNKNIPTFGAYGDIMIRDRKMYVVKTPYAIADGLAGTRTLIIPSGDAAPSGLAPVGEVERVEAAKVAVGYEFDLRTNDLRVIEEPNPTGGTRHTFTAYRLPTETTPAVQAH